MRVLAGVVAFLVFGAAGVFLVRAVWLDPIEIMGWNLFWNGVSSGQLMDLELLSNSTTFQKCLAGGLVLGILGLVFVSIARKKRKAPSEGKSSDTQRAAKEG